MNKNYRLDSVDLPKVSFTEEGYIKGEAIVTRTGVFKYINKDGTERYELRHPDDVFEQNSLDTLKLIPITNNHPTSCVNSDTASSVMVGMTGENVKVSEDGILSTLTVTDKKTINVVKSGRQELSLGYKLNRIKEEGNYKGQKYTHRQTDIRYNHLALVDTARAGRSARINFDSVEDSDDIWVEDSLMDQESQNTINTNNTEKAIITSEKEMEDSKELLKKLETENLKLKTEISSLKKVNNDSANDIKIKELKAELKELKDINLDSIVGDMFKSRLDIYKKAVKVVNLDSDKFINMDSMSDRDVMQVVIKEFDSSANFDGLEDSYVKGRFDAIVSNMDSVEHIAPSMEGLKRNSMSSSFSKDPQGIAALKTHIQTKKK